VGRRFPKHKMTRYAKNLRGRGPLSPLGYAYESGDNGNDHSEK